ncbi:MAG: hypothetical protein ABIT38_02055, partial [Gemmatimonadaceae bacterium]
MRLTISRWISYALVSVSILVVSSLFVVGERGDSGSFDTYEHIPPVLAMRDRARSGALLTAVREHIELSTRESWEHARTMAPKAGLVFDERLPASMRVKIASALAPQLDVLSSDSIAARVALFVHFDTTSLESWAAPLEASGRSYGRAIARTLLFPPASG